MEKEIKKILYKVLPFVLCICIVSGAAAPAYASPTTPDLEAQYLWDLSWTTSSNPSGKNNSWYGVIRILLKDIFDKLSLVQSDQRNIWTYNSTSYRLKNFTDTTSLSESYYINSGAYPMSWLLNSMANLSQNSGYTANQFYNSNSNLNNAINAMVSLNANFKDYTTVLNNIKSNTDNLSGIKTNTDYLSGIKTDTSNLSAILTGVTDFKTDNHTDITSVKTSVDNFKTANHTDIKSFQNDYNDITWTNTDIGVEGYYRDPSNDKITSTTSSNNWYIKLSASSVLSNHIYRLSIPLYIGGLIDVNINSEFGYLNNGVFTKISDAILSTDERGTSTLIYFYVPEHFYISPAYYCVHLSNSKGNMYINPAGGVSSAYIDYTKKDYYTVFENLIDRNILKLFKQAKEVFFDDKTIAAKKANQDQEDSVLSNFTGSGAASASVSDFGAVKDSMVDLKAGFNGGASSSDTFSFLSGDSNAWDWFTQDTANDVDRTQRSNTRLLRGSSDVASDTPLLDSYYTAILSILGGDD